MAFKHGRNAIILIDQFDVSAYFMGSDESTEIDLPDTTTYGASAHRRQVVGLKDGTMSLQGYHDTVAGGSQAVLVAIYGGAAASVVTKGPEGGAAIGLPATMLSAREKSLKSGSPVDGVVPISSELTADGGIDLAGKFQKALGATTITGNSTSIDNGAATTNGGVGHIHATTISGTPTLDAVVADSADDSSFATILTFAQLAAAGKQRVEIAGNVRRYTREQHTVGGGSPSVTYAVAFARR